ncbi:MAG: PspC domain-containing protein [Cyclobacteriaceae bacterium]
MKKNISINIGGIIFHIEEDGYDKLKNYLDSVNKYFSSFEDSKEIIEDIEGRIAEIFLTRLDEGKQIINKEDVDDLVAIMGTTKDFDAEIEVEPVGPSKEETKEEEKEEKESESKKTGTADKKLHRDNKRKVIGGVASGLAHYFGIDPIWVRLLMLAFLFNIFFWGLSGFVFLTYIILWIAVPSSDKLEDDKAVKKLYRDMDDRVLGGVSSGIASYFGVDRVLIRVLFVFSIFLGGAGLIAYIILWIITPEAKTITEKMQMQGEPVTISNIEENVKKGLKVKDGEENIFVKILLFPFRLIAMIFKALGELLGPLLKFSVEALRIIVGVFFVFLGFVLMISFSITLAVLLGIGGAMENWVYFGGFPAEYIAGSMSTISLVSAYFVAIVPSLAIALLGLTIIVKKAVTRAFVGWVLFGIWLLGMIGLAFSVPMLVRDFSAENKFREEKAFQVAESVPTLGLNDVFYDYDRDYRYDAVDLRLRGHADSTYLLELEFESRGRTRAEAKENAEAVDYKVEIDGDDILFDSDLSFNSNTPFRFQTLNATFYIPYGKVFRMDDELADILINTLHLNGYRSYQMKGNDWVFDDDGINCLTCSGKRDRNRDYSSQNSRRKGSDTERYQFADFDEVKLETLFDFEIQRGDTWSVELEGDEDYLDKISIIQRGDELNVKYDTNWKWWKDKDWKRKVKIFIVMPELDHLEVSGACEGDVTGFSNDEISLKIRGASEVFADLSTKFTYVDLTGASQLTLVGETENLEADVIGASKLSAFNFDADDVEVRAVGASTVRITANTDLEADASGASTIRYRGNPRVSLDSRGLSSIKKD